MMSNNLERIARFDALDAYKFMKCIMWLGQPWLIVYVYRRTEDVFLLVLEDEGENRTAWHVRFHENTGNTVRKVKVPARFRMK